MVWFFSYGGKTALSLYHDIILTQMTRNSIKTIVPAHVLCRRSQGTQIFPLGNGGEAAIMTRLMFRNESGRVLQEKMQTRGKRRLWANRHPYAYPPPQPSWPPLTVNRDTSGIHSFALWGLASPLACAWFRIMWPPIYQNPGSNDSHLFL